ncbi:hypothetical protein RND81_08G177700 [Saponaria officinalis]|uniref:Retrovirus-related Pol polyprotein from transposon TNT 1-94-like beta-barrel domain-containing protein n=1 Tax=Saponaria officinalis TaxID=3572 RepID=A0AAW1J8S4_SAPOF
MSAMSRIIPDLSKLEPLDGNNYKRWSQKLLMFFEQLEIDYVLFKDPPKPAVPTNVETTPPVTVVVKSNEKEIKKFEKDNKTARKVSPSWSDYRNHLKHKKKDLSLQELVGHMRTEEANRLKDKPVSFPINTVKVNLIESSGPSYAGPSNAAKFKGKGKTKGGPGQAKNQGPSAKINGPGKHTKPCTRKKTAKANVAETDDIIAAAIVEANLVGNVAEWILDTGASRHFCADKGLFVEFEEVADGECVYMGNSSSAMMQDLSQTHLRKNSCFKQCFVCALVTSKPSVWCLVKQSWYETCV